jgi:demethylmenaquinone methyltransferase/2-methoxy-6-polyprenyl-1,4-benzoquinol methylase
VTLRSTIATPHGKQRYVRRLFATVADRYDFITRFLSYGQDARWKHRLIERAQLTSSDRVLDLACGTGDILFAASARSRLAVGLDLTHRMLQLASKRAAAREGSRYGAGVRGPGVDGPPPVPRLITGDMLALPFAASQFDIVTVGYGLRNVPDIERAIAEIHRVLAAGGRLLSLDFNKPGNPIVRAAYLTYLTLVGSMVGFALHGDPDTYRYIPESIRLYPGAAGVARLLERQGFVSVEVVPLLGGLMALHVARKWAPLGDEAGDPLAS